MQRPLLLSSKFMAWMEGCGIQLTINASSFSLSFSVLLSLSLFSRFPFPGIDLFFWLQTEIMKFFRLSVLILRLVFCPAKPWRQFPRYCKLASPDNTKHLCVSLSLATTLAVEVPESQGCEGIFRGENMAARHPWVSVAPFPDLTR